MISNAVMRFIVSFKFDGWDDKMRNTWDTNSIFMSCLRGPIHTHKSQTTVLVIEKLASKMNLWVVLVVVTVFVPLLQVNCQAESGYGCREGDLPNEVRRDCHPEPSPSEAVCRERGCVWCNKSEIFPGFPPCFFYEATYEPPGASCDNGYAPAPDRIDCTIEDEPIDEMSCRYKNCTWCPSLPEGVPWCFISAAPDSTGYSIVGDPIESPNGVSFSLSKTFPNDKPFWDGEAASLTFDAEFQSDYRLRIKISDGTPRFQVPLQVDPPSTGNDNLLYELQYERSPFSFRVVRKSSGSVVFDSKAGKLTFADQFLSMSWSLPTENVYGIGENEQRTLKHNFSEALKWPLFPADQAPFHTAATYGAFPHYTVIEEDGNVHAVVLVNSNSQEFHMLPGPTVKYITIGGIFDLYFFLGPTPDDSVSQFTEAFGRSQMPAYWALGFHLCRYGYNTLEKMQLVVNRNIEAGVPIDVQYGDIDIMRNELDFTYDTTDFAGLPEYIQELKSQGIKFVTILDPCISAEEGPDYRPFTLGDEMDVWYKRADGSPVVGRVWPNFRTSRCYFPDYFKNSTREWWIELIVEFHDLLAWDGLWIDMNEPTNFEDGDWDEGCASNRWNYPPYKPGLSTQIMAWQTLCGDHVDSVSTHYNTHSLYGWSESEPTLMGVRQATGKRGLVLSRSTFLGSQRWTTHWLGDNWSRWSNLHFSIIGTIQFNLWGIPHVGPDICGHYENATAPLCQRWSELGAFYPYARNHNSRIYSDQDPAVWPEVAAAAKAALEVRYTLLPYLYTLFYDHVTRGSAVFRPLWYNYPSDPVTHTIDKQFMWGSGILVSPVLSEAATTVTAYFPNVRHYNYYDGIQLPIQGGTAELQAPLDYIPVHVVGGNVIPTQEPAMNTEASRNNPFGLIVALDSEGMASGSLFFDDGDGIDTHLNGQYFYAEYIVRNGTLNANVLNDGYFDMTGKIVDTVRLLGAGTITSVIVNGQEHTAFETKPGGEVTITSLNLIANFGFTIQFD